MNMYNLTVHIHLMNIVYIVRAYFSILAAYFVFIEALTR